MLSTNSMYPLISKPTRITSSTATLIDNIFTNNLEQSMSSGILYTDLSDHLPIFQVTHLKLDVEPLCQKRLARLVNPTTIAAFRSRVETIEWSQVYNSDSTDDSYKIHSLAFLCQHTLNHFHLNHYILSAAILRNPGLQKVSLYPATGRIFSINNSKQTLLYLTNLDITSIEISTISY